jgi:putative oxidoreductase
MIHFMKNLAIAGGFLALAASGPGAWSLDARLKPGLAPAHA